MSSQLPSRSRTDRAPAASCALTAIRWHAPIPRPAKNVFCLGLNYLAHARESGRASGKEPHIPQVPVFFTKAPTSITGPNDDVTVDPSVTGQVDWEVELGVVIGLGGRNIRRADALQHVFGYTVINDIAQRRFRPNPNRKKRAKDAFFDWLHGKWFDSFCPCGPCVTAADAIPDPQALRMRLEVNGAVRQDATTAQQIFPVAAVIEFISQMVTLEPGDIISTGTPAGVGSTTGTFL